MQIVIHVENRDDMSVKILGSVVGGEDQRFVYSTIGNINLCFIGFGKNQAMRARCLGEMLIAAADEILIEQVTGPDPGD